jgi:hypothetical protein
VTNNQEAATRPRRSGTGLFSPICHSPAAGRRAGSSSERNPEMTRAGHWSVAACRRLSHLSCRFSLAAGHVTAALWTARKPWKAALGKRGFAV